MSRFWKRKIELIGGGKSFTNDMLEIDFRVPFDDDDEPNISTIEIYNLSNDSINAVTKGKNIILNAGYEGNVGTILQGTIESCHTRWEGVDKITRLTVAEGSEQWLTAYVSKSFKPGITATAILRDLTGQFGMELVDFKLENDKTYPRGRSVSGMLQSVMRQIVQETGSKFHISNGKIYIRPWSSGNETGFLLNSDTGLIESPQPFEEQDADGSVKSGYKVKMLLNHRVNVDSIIRIESKTVTGNFRVQKGTHYGDFITDVEVLVP